MTIVDLVDGRIHVLSGAALELAGAALEGVLVTVGYARISGSERNGRSHHGPTR